MMFKRFFLLLLIFVCSVGGFEITQYPATIEKNGRIIQNIDKTEATTKTCSDTEPNGYGYEGCLNNSLDLKVNEAISLDLKSVGDFNFLKVKNTDKNPIEVNIRLQPDKIASPLEYDAYQESNKTSNGRRLMVSTFSRIDLAMLYEGDEINNDAIEWLFAPTADILDVYGAANSMCRGSQKPEVGVCFTTPLNWTTGKSTDVSTEMNTKMTLQPDEIGFIIFRTTYPFGDPSGWMAESKYPSEKGFNDNKSFDGKVGQCQAGRSVTDFKCWADAKKTKEVNNEECIKAKNDYINAGIKPQATQSIATFSWSDESCDKYDPVEEKVDIEGITITTHPSTSLVAKNIPEGSNHGPLKLIGDRNVVFNLNNSTDLNCRDRTNNKGTKFTKAELYDGNDILIQSSEDAADVIVQNKIQIDNFKLSNIEIPNKEGKNLNYKQMYLKTTCDAAWGVKQTTGTNDVEYVYFDARPARLLRKTPAQLKNADKLYAQYSYGFEANGAGNESIEHLRKFTEGEAKEKFSEDELKALFCEYEDGEHKGTGILQTYVNDRSKAAGYNYTVHYDTSDFNNKQIFEAIDVNGDVVKGYDSARMEVVIASKLITADEADKNLPCKDEPGKCQIGYIQLNGGTNVNNVMPIPKGIYTDFGTRYALEFKHIGPTQIFGHDNTWAIFSRDRSLDSNTLCIVDSASNIPNANGVIGCDIGLSEKSGAMTTPDNPDEETIDFYTFTPAAMKIQIELKNSPVNDSYGTDKWTYISNIQREMEKRKKEATANNRVPPFESADLNISVYALGANKNNFCSDNPSVVNRFTYNADLKVHNLNFSGSPKNPYINEAEPTSELFMNNIEDFAIKATSEKLFKKDELAIYQAEISRPQKAGFNYEFDYVIDDFKDAKNILDTQPVSLDRPASDFLGGKNISEYRLNFIRNDLLASNYVNIKQDDFKIISDENTWKWLKNIGEIAVALSVKGDLTFVDAAMIAPDFAHNNDKGNVDQAVYLAGYCDSNCDKAGIFGEKVPNHITYRTLAFSPLPGDEKSLFDYENATFQKHKAGADMINGFIGNEVSVLLQSKVANKDELEKYCEIFRNCLKLGEDKYGLTFKVFSATENNWHGAGDQGTTILDGKNADGKNTQNKRHRSNSRLGR